VNGGVLGDIPVVVVIDERMVVDRVIQRQGRNNQEKTQNYVALFGRREKS